MPVIGAPLTRASIPDYLELGVRKAIFDQWDKMPSKYEQIYNMGRAEKKTITDVIGAGLGVMPLHTEGQQVTFDAMQEAWKRAYNVLDYALGIEVTRNARKDDLYGFVEQGGKELGRTAKYTKNVEAMSLLNNLSDTLYTAGGSNYTLLMTTHFRVDGGTWSNRPTNPVDLSLESLEAALIQFRTGMLDQRGRKFDITPKKLCVGPSDLFVAHRLVESQQRPFSNNNDPNIIKTEYDLSVLVLDHMTDDSRWFLMADKEETGLNYFDREDLSVERGDDPRTGNMLMTAWWRAAWGASHVTGVWGTPP